MAGEYKLKLLQNLKNNGYGAGWFISTDRMWCDEITFTLPENEDSEIAADKLYNILESLPEIEFPKERVKFIFRNVGRSMHDCQIRVINPNDDEMNTIAMSSTIFVSDQEYRRWHLSRDPEYLEKYRKK